MSSGAIQSPKDEAKPVDNYSGYIEHDPPVSKASDGNEYSGYLSHQPRVNTISDADSTKFSLYLHPLAKESLASEGSVDKQDHQDSSAGKPVNTSTGKPVNSSTGKPINMRELRFDSGVADLEQSPVHGTPSPVNAFRPISTNKTYDYADYGSHQYEELPHSRLNPSGIQLSPGSTDSRSSDNQSSAGTTVTISDVPSDAGDTANIVRSQSQKDEEQRKRYNPLYDTMINSTPNIYNKVRVTRESMLQTQIRLLRIIVVILIFISCTSLSLSLYLIISNSTDSTVKNLETEVSSLEKNIDTLQTRISQVESLMAGNLSFEHLAQLGQKVLDLELAVSSNFTSFDNRIKVTDNTVTVNQNKISMVYSNFTSSLSSMNSSVQYQLDTISKMPGPTGPQGVGNLTACFMQEYSRGSTNAEQDTITDYYPLDEDLKTLVVMSVFCSVRYGQYSRVEVNRPVDSDYRTVKYRCLCSGTQSGQSFRYCQIHLWLCPRETFGGS